MGLDVLNADDDMQAIEYTKRHRGAEHRSFVATIE